MHLPPTRAQGNFASAIAHLQQALRKDPDDQESQHLIRHLRKVERGKKAGNDAFKEGRFAEAVRVRCCRGCRCRRVCSHSPLAPTQLYQEALDLGADNPDFNAQLHCNRATALAKLSRHEEAVADCDQALRLKPDYLKAFLRRITCLRELGGIEHLERALRDIEAAAEHTEDRSVIHDLQRQCAAAPLPSAPCPSH